MTWHRNLGFSLVRCFGGWNGRVCGEGVCTLLGPEGPDESPQPLGLFFMLLVGVGGGYRPYFENYTVDASIFDATPSGVVS